MVINMFKKISKDPKAVRFRNIGEGRRVYNWEREISIPKILSDEEVVAPSWGYHDWFSWFLPRLKSEVSRHPALVT